jgi:hypothetical protein
VSTMTDAYTWKGRELLGSDGEKIGSIREIYEDVRSGKPTPLDARGRRRSTAAAACGARGRPPRGRDRTG